MKKIIIAGDSTCDLPEELIEKYDMKIIPLGINIGDENFKDSVDITPTDIYAKFDKTGVVPKTCAVNVSEFEKFFYEHTQEDNSLILFTLSSKISSTYNNACIAAESFSDVYVMDSGSISTGSGLLMLAAAQMSEKGCSPQEITDKCKRLVPFVDVSFVLDNLEFMSKGGRCSAVTALGANILKLKPQIKMCESEMKVCKKYRGCGQKVLTQYIDDQLEDIDSIYTDAIFITHANCDENILSQCYEQVKAKGVFKEIFVTNTGCTVASHCGKGTLGLLFLRKS